MNPLSRRTTFAVLLVVVASLQGGASLLPLPWSIVAIVAVSGLAFLVGVRLLWAPERLPAVLEPPLVLTPVLEVPSAFQPEEIPQEEPEPLVEDVPEDILAVTTLAVPDVVPAERVLLDEFLPLLAELAEAFQQPDPMAGPLAELQSGTDFVKENVLRSYEISDNLANSAKEAFDLAEKVQSGIMIVTTALTESLHQTEVLYQHSQRIAKILNLLSEVSDKIHILSINASIVSARAGGLGRGFEVVAKEIRSLARETEVSLGEIEEVIGLLQSTISNVIRVVNDADKETELEKSHLISVAGSLQFITS